jgi:hypothetical protein
MSGGLPPQTIGETRPVVIGALEVQRESAVSGSISKAWHWPEKQVPFFAARLFELTFARPARLARATATPRKGCVRH